MESRRIARFLVAWFLLVLPPAAWAQSGISGVVRDGSGAVLPGVQVDARSPALIEQVRTVYTDSQGIYRIIDLRPGTYTVTFTLAAFRTVIREGIELPAAFTATVNADLSLGAIEESVTVTGAAPLVDTQNVVQQLTVSSEVRDAIPLPTSSAAYVVLIPGATQAPQDRDVGGVRGEQAQVFAIHGTNNNNLRQMRDGMDTSSLFGGGNRIISINPATVTEIIVLSAGDAKAEGNGALVDVVPRDGGNEFHGTFQANVGQKNLQSTNIDAALVARGAPNPGDIKTLYDWGYGVGGPIAHNRLWFHTAGRRWLTENFLPGNFFNATQGTPFYTPDTSRPGFENNYYYELNNRLMWQAAERHKVSFTYVRDRSCQCHVGQRPGTLAPEASGDNRFEPGWRVQSKWTMPATSRLLFDAGFSMVRFNITRVGTGGGPEDFAITDLDRNYTYGHHARAFDGPPTNGGQYINRNVNVQGNVSYVTGSHAFSTGGQMRYAGSELSLFINHGMTLGFRGTTPAEVTEWASPFLNDVRHRMLGLYVQDYWTIHRLTLNLGLRFDDLHAWSPEIVMPAGPRVPARVAPAVDDAIGWRDLNMRVGFAYDVFGNSRTALKAGMGRYVPQLRFNDQQQYSSARQASLSTTRTWNDLNGDFIPQDNELGPRDNANFGLPVQNIRYARDVTHGWGNRPFNYQASVQLEHQLLDNVAVGVGYFRTWFGNFLVSNNEAVSRTDFNEYTFTVPADPRLPGGGGQVITGLFNQTPASFGRVDRVVGPASEFGDQQHVYDGVDISVRGRFPSGALITGGVSVGRTVLDRCDVVAGNPQLLVQADSSADPTTRASTLGPNCRIQPPWSAQTNLKLAGILPLPYDFQVSATWQNLPPIPTDANFVLGPTDAQAQLGRRLTGGAADRTIQLVNPQSYYTEPRGNQIDFRVSRRFRMGTARVEPQFNVYNLTNANDVLTMVTRFGPDWQNRPNVLPARLIKLGLQIDF
jgi:hypothetical protein